MRKVILLLILIAALCIATAYPLWAEDQCKEENQSDACPRPSGSSPWEETAVSPSLPPPESMPSKSGKVSVQTGNRIAQSPAAAPVLYFFWGEGCPYCERQKAYLKELSVRYPTLQIKSFNIYSNKDDMQLLRSTLVRHGATFSGIPVTIIGNKVITGFSDQKAAEIESAVAAMTGRGLPMQQADAALMDIPLIGRVDAASLSLPVTTVMIAGLDSFNPCAFFVLLSLLGILAYAKSRPRMLMVGGVFVFFSGLIYFIFMAAWLNLFLLVQNIQYITAIAGAVSVVIAIINIKDFFAFGHGPSLSIPDAAKPKLFDRMRRLLKTSSVPAMLTGAAVLAIMANSYELLCTAGFPMVYTRILTLHALTGVQYYLYLVLYNIIYVIPLAVIAIAFSLTLGRYKLTEWQGRILKLLSGTMMLALGLVLIFNPALMNSLLASSLIMAGSLSLSLIVAVVGKYIYRPLRKI